MNKSMPARGWSAFGGKKIIILSLGIVLLAAACNRNEPANNNTNGQSNNQTNPSPTPTPPAPTPTPTPPQPMSGEVLITMTSSGFSPANVTVKKGTKVTFINNDNKARWPASAPHPSHTDYPEFDAKRGISAGQSYSFTFDKTGTWRFHDHLTPTQFGSVTVQE